MPDVEQLLDGLEQAGLASWRPSLESLLRKRLADRAHGDMPGWRSIVDALPEIHDTRVMLDRAAITADSPSIDSETRLAIQDLLKKLRPWRKGPFRLFGIDVDAEWRSDLKWERLAGAIAPLAGRRILDVGCGKGYYAYRMTGAGARQVVGIDPTLLYFMQFRALNHYFDISSIHLLPLRLQELPDSGEPFDTSFSMGVLYHQRDTGQHLAQLRNTLRPGGELVLETLIFPGDDDVVHEPENRYARMRNVWHLPSAVALQEWLAEAGFRDARILDVTVTTVDEQRKTDWMPFESLAEALDPRDNARTVEGLPAPRRALVICTAP